MHTNRTKGAEIRWPCVQAWAQAYVQAFVLACVLACIQGFTMTAIGDVDGDGATT